MDKTQPARVAPECQAELNAMTDAAEARRSATTAGGLTDADIDAVLQQSPIKAGYGDLMSLARATPSNII